MTEGRGVFLRVGLLIVGGWVLVAGLVWFFAGSRVSRGIEFET